MRAAIILGALLLAFNFISLDAANAQNACMDRCTANGSPYGLCQERCSSGRGGNGNSNGSGQSGSGQHNYACMSECTSRGYPEDFCRARCN
jgi:hypothetical protein